MIQEAMANKSVCFAGNFIVSSGHPLATLSAIDVLRAGGNAFDAALAASAVLNVVLPMSCGLGGDLVLCGWVARTRRPVCFAALGRTPCRAGIHEFNRLGYERIPLIGPLSSTVPAAFDAYPTIHSHLCTIGLQDIFRQAISCARDGFVVTPQVSRWIANNLNVLAGNAQLMLRFAPSGQPPAIGDVILQPQLAKAYEMLAAFDGDSRPREEFICTLVTASDRQGGVLCEADFLSPGCVACSPLAYGIGNLQLFTPPLPTQGYMLLQSLAALSASAVAQEVTDAGRVHIMCEILNEVFSQRLTYAADPEFADNTCRLLSSENIRAIVDSIRPDSKSSCLYSGYYSLGDTTHLCVVDHDRNAASITQSLGLGFGAGVGCDELGVIFNNRLGRSCTLKNTDLNSCRPMYRPVNTILSYVAADSDGVRLVGGTPGGDGQVQWSFQVLDRYLLRGASLLEAVVSPRWVYYPGCDLQERERKECLVVDEAFSSVAQDELRRLGYNVVQRGNTGGCVRAIESRPGLLVGVDDGRQEGLTLGL